MHCVKHVKAKGVGVGKQQQQIEGNVWMVIYVCVCVYIYTWTNTPRLSSDHTDSLPSPAVPPDTHIFTAAFLHSEARRRPQQHARPNSKTQEEVRGARHYSERQIGHPNKTRHPEHGIRMHRVAVHTRLVSMSSFDRRIPVHKFSQWLSFGIITLCSLFVVLSFKWPANIASCDQLRVLPGLCFTADSGI